MAETKTMTVDILREETINGKVWTPQQSIVPESVGKELLARKAAVKRTPDMTAEELTEKEAATVAAAEKAANK